MSRITNSDWFINLAAIAIIIAFIAGLLTVVWGINNHTAHVSCLRLHEVTQLETRFVRSGWNGECYVKVDGRWIPESRWRLIED